MAQTATQRSWLDRLWGSIADQGRASARLPPSGLAAPERVVKLASALVSERGEASGAALARELIGDLQGLLAEDRLHVLRTLSENYAPDPGKLRDAAEAYLRDPTPEAATTLHAAAEPPRQELLRRMNMAAGGTAMLVELRRDVLCHVQRDPVLRPLDHDLLHLFSSWFNRGFLELRRIGWDTSAAVLEKLLRYEAVHEIAGWEDLRRRLLPDRRCFAFFHQALPNEPLIFVEVALTAGLAGAVQPLLSPPDDPAGPPPKGADTAIFYSISNCQEGLRGVSFGNFLIKQVVEDLQAELPHIKTFATLSPMPRFRAWLEESLRNAELDCTEDERAALTPFAAAVDGSAAMLAEATQGAWWHDGARAAALRPPLLRFAANYLLKNHLREKIDPVAQFHLGNGASLARINWLGNTAPRGIQESFGIMVNYLYDPDSIAANHESFIKQGAVACSSEVEAASAGRIRKV